MLSPPPPSLAFRRKPAQCVSAHTCIGPDFSTASSAKRMYTLYGFRQRNIRVPCINSTLLYAGWPFERSKNNTDVSINLRSIRALSLSLPCVRQSLALPMFSLAGDHNNATRHHPHTSPRALSSFKTAHINYTHLRTRPFPPPINAPGEYDTAKNANQSAHVNQPPGILRRKARRRLPFPALGNSPSPHPHRHVHTEYLICPHTKLHFSPYLKPPLMPLPPSGSQHKQTKKRAQSP